VYATVMEGVMYAAVMAAPLVKIVLVGLCQYMNCSITTDCRTNSVTICVRLV
jgi:hypothetical protein